MNNKKVVSAVIISIILIVVVLLSIRQQKSQKPVLTPEITLVYAENQVEDYPTTKGAYEFARLVNEKTNGRIKIIVKCNGELGDEKSVIEQLKFGGIDFSRVSVASISDDIPELKVIQMPFLYSDAQVKPLLYYFAAIFIVLLLVTYIPAISLWLPGLLGYVK